MSNSEFKCNSTEFEYVKIEGLNSDIMQAISILKLSGIRVRYSFPEIYALIPRIENEVNNDALVTGLRTKKNSPPRADERTWDTWLDVDNPEDPTDHWDTWMDNHWDKYVDPDFDDDKPMNPNLDSIDANKPIEIIVPIEFPNKRDKTNKK